LLISAIERGLTPRTVLHSPETLDLNSSLVLSRAPQLRATLPGRPVSSSIPSTASSRYAPATITLLKGTSIVSSIASSTSSLYL
jgi:hypothetical protein